MELIRSVYARAGLQLNDKNDRCQYFEAHGTGTPAGDPIEAEAIHSAFFGTCSSFPDTESNDDVPLYVGSIKTVIGHPEGAAGLAGVLKASLALQNGVIPPNLLFNKLNPAVKPFYDHLKIPTAAMPWPVVPDGYPRRASVNRYVGLISVRNSYCAEKVMLDFNKGRLETIRAIWGPDKLYIEEMIQDNARCFPANLKQHNTISRCSWHIYFMLH